MNDKIKILENFKMRILMYALVFGAISLWIMTPHMAATAGTTTYYVNPTGSDTNSGTAIQEPFKTIQQAINLVQPGDTIELASGTYFDDIITKTDGTAGSPITITGPADAIIKGGGNDRVFEINHDYYTLNGFTIDGLYDPNKGSSGYRDILIYVLGKQTRSGVDGLTITNMVLKNAGGECVRLRYFVTNAEIAYNTITDCGVYDFVFNAGGKNGEGIYIGTSNKQWGDGKNPTSDPDETRDNSIHHNYIETNGNECVDLKEGTTANIIEHNTCRGQKDPNSGGIGSRGSGNIIRYNDIRNSIGAGVRLGGWLVNGTQYGENNDVYENTIVDNENGGIKFQAASQGKICENIMSGNTNGDAVGTYGSDFDPTASCTSTPPPNTPTTPDITPNPAPQTPPNVDTGSLANDQTLIADSNNFSDGYRPSHLWDGCYEGSAYNSNTCTSGGRDIPSFWLEFDLKKLYDLSQARLYGDADGTWVSKTWGLSYKKNSNDAWTTAFSGKNALSNSWSTETLDIQARYVRIEVFGDSEQYSPGRTQARELELYGTEAVADTTTPSPAPAAPTPAPSDSNSSSNNSNSGGGGGGGASTTSSSNGSENENSINLAPPSQHMNTLATSTEQNALEVQQEIQQEKSVTSAQTATLEKIVVFTKSLYRGITDGEVKKLQTFLAQDASLYPEGLITGYFGTLTTNAVKKFQCTYNIVCSGNESSTGYGRVGPATLAKLNEVISQSASLRKLFSFESSPIPHKQVYSSQPNYTVSESERSVVESEKKLVLTVDKRLTNRLKGRILLQVESRGEAWYVDKTTGKKFYLKDGTSAYQALRYFGLGITNADLAKIPVGVENRFKDTDSDGDGLADKLEEGLKTDPANADTDNDGLTDGYEVLTSNSNPLGTGALYYSASLANQLKGKIVLQVESRGEAWYVNPENGKRYYMKDGSAAYQIMRFLSLGITNSDLRKIEVGSL